MGSLDHGSQRNKKNFAFRPVNLEQLEARMMCTINELQACLALVDSPLEAPTVSAVTRNAAPTVSRPVGATGVSNGVVTTKSVAVSALGADDKGESKLKYSWTVDKAPSGGQVTISANGTNAAKNTTLTFNKAGTYSIRLQITDAEGASTTRLQQFTVVPTLTTLLVQSGGTTLANNSSVSIGGTERSVTVRGLDQFGAAMSSQPKITWTKVSAPAGATVKFTTTNPTSNGSTGLIAYTKVGAYSIEASSGSLKSRFTLNVTQALTTISVTPGTADVAAGKQQAFKASALDQFKQPMNTPPTFTWTATGGTVSTAGVFTAGKNAGTFAVTAKSGTVTAQATVKVTVTSGGSSTPSGPTGGTASDLKDAALKSLVQTYFADGSISRTEMIQLLRSAGNDGTVSSTELVDLRYVVSNATKYKIADYVQNLAGDVVNSNPANALYQGSTLGNLTAGSSAAQLNKLVDKWFLGTDRPTLTSPSISYRAASGSLFVGQPTYTDQRQGMLGDCYFIAALGSLSTSNPAAIQNMFIDNGDGTYTVRFYGGTYGAFYNPDGTISDGFANGVGVADYVTVDRLLPSFSNGTFAYSNYGMSLSSPTNALWIALAEKAYAQWNATGNSGRSGVNTYASIEGGWMSNVDAQVLGYNATRYSFSTSTSEQALISALNSNYAVTAGTRTNGLTNGLVGSHAYTIRGYDATTKLYTLYNPWGSSQPTPLTWAQMQSNLTQFVVANPAATKAFLVTAVANTITVRNQSETIIMQATSTEYTMTNTTSNPTSSTELESYVIDSSSESVVNAIETESHEQYVATESEISEDVAEQSADAPSASAVDLLFDIDRLDALFEDLLS